MNTITPSRTIIGASLGSGDPTAMLASLKSALDDFRF